MAAILWRDPIRAETFSRWLGAIADAHRIDIASLRPASADASFRRYLRADCIGGGSVVIMDAPPPQEDTRPFARIADLLARAGLHVPRVLAQDAGSGFLLLDDLGDTPYLRALQGAQAEGDRPRCDRLMRDATTALITLQRGVDANALPPYDDTLLRRELALFPDWCVSREYDTTWSASDASTWQATCDLLVASALATPTVAVHRDWMPRNLMVADPNPGVLDFQDAVRGPITYDIACLLRDAFISWDEAQEIDWAVRYWQQARKALLPVDADFGEFWRALEWMALQRHLKVLGIFSRLKHRDGKPAYSAELARFFGYAHKTASRYAPLEPLARLLEPLMGTSRVEAFH